MSARARHVAVVLAVCAALVGTIARGRADEPAEPPPEAAAGDWSIERNDSLAAGWVETTFSAGGRLGSAPRTGQRVRLRGNGVDAAFRAGDDPLSGGHVNSPLASGTLQAGGLAPRWGRGLLLGAPAQPWNAEPDDRGDGGTLRGHAADGALYRSHSGAVDVLVARFGTRTLAGARLRLGRASLGVLAGSHTAAASAAVVSGDAAAELAADDRGRWRGEFSARRKRGALRASLRARGGLVAFRSFAEPRRAGPARLVAAQAERARGGTVAHGQLGWWAYDRAVSGAQASLDMERRLVHHASFAFGFDEQHGTQRDPALGAVPAAGTSMRQGWWCAWRGRFGGRALELRHELRGGRAFARQAMRRALTARGESTLPLGGTLVWSQSAWSTRAGETLYLSESEDDRLTLHPATGLGRRTRIELALPMLGGRGRASVQWTETPAGSGKPAWTMEWTRRMRQ